MGGPLLFNSYAMLELEEEFIVPIRKLIGTPRPIISIYRGEGCWGTVEPATKSAGLGHYAIGTISEKGWIGTSFAGWSFVEMPGCCGVLISTGAHVIHAYRGKGVGTLLNEYRKRVAKTFGYGLLLCTDILTNDSQQKILDKNGWKQITAFRNPRTGNTIGMHEVVL